MVVFYDDKLNTLEFKLKKAYINTNSLSKRHAISGAILAFPTMVCAIVIFYAIIRVELLSLLITTLIIAIIYAGCYGINGWGEGFYNEVYFKENGIELLRMKKDKKIFISSTNIKEILFAFKNKQRWHGGYRDKTGVLRVDNWDLSIDLKIKRKDAGGVRIYLGSCVDYYESPEYSLNFTGQEIKHNLDEGTRVLELLKNYCVINYKISPEKVNSV